MIVLTEYGLPIDVFDCQISSLKTRGATDRMPLIGIQMGPCFWRSHRGIHGNSMKYTQINTPMTDSLHCSCFILLAIFYYFFKCKRHGKAGQKCPTKPISNQAKDSLFCVKLPFASYFAYACAIYLLWTYGCPTLIPKQRLRQCFIATNCMFLVFCHPDKNPRGGERKPDSPE